MKGKTLTNGAKILGALIVLASLILKAVGIAPMMNIDEAIKTASFIVVIFAPVDVSLWIKTALAQKGSVSGGQEWKN